MRFNGFGLDLSIRLPWEKKSSEAAPLIYLQYGNQSNGVYHARNPAQYADDAFKRNVVAYRAISVIARSAAYIPMRVKVGDKHAEDSHDLVKLLKRPNPWTNSAAFVESVIAYRLLGGNTYVEGVGPDNAPPAELWSLRADRMRVAPGRFGPEGYIYEVNGQKKVWKCDPITGASQIMHMKAWNPLNDWYGMSPVEAAAYSIDGHNMAGEWNQALLQNAARPSGALVYKNQQGSTLTDRQYDRLKEQINSAYSGSRNAGRPIILEGDLDWKQMSLSPADMDWINGKNIAAREIAQVFGCPPQILGIPGDNTYSNYQEARQSMYEDTVIPLHNELCEHLNLWLCPAFGDDVTIESDIEDLPALAPRREKRWTMVQNANWMTVNEKREATGLEPLDIPEADDIMLPSGLVPLGAEVDDSEALPGIDPMKEDDENPEDAEKDPEDAEAGEDSEDSKPGKPPKGSKPGEVLTGKKPGKKFFGFMGRI